MGGVGRGRGFLFLRLEEGLSTSRGGGATPCPVPPRRRRDRPRGRVSPAKAPLRPRRAHGSAGRKAARKTPHKAPRPRPPRVAWRAYARGHARARARPRRASAKSRHNDQRYICRFCDGYVQRRLHVPLCNHATGQRKPPQSATDATGRAKARRRARGDGNPPSHAGPNPQKQPSRWPLLGGRRDDARGGDCPPNRA